MQINTLQLHNNREWSGCCEAHEPPAVLPECAQACHATSAAWLHDELRACSSFGYALWAVHAQAMSLCSQGSSCHCEPLGKAIMGLLS